MVTKKRNGSTTGSTKKPAATGKARSWVRGGSKAGGTTRKRSPAPKPRKQSSKNSGWSKFFKILLFGMVLGIVGLAAGSAYMQISIKNILRERALSSFAVVVSRPFALAQGVRPKAAKLDARLKRLRYSLRDEAPERPGQARISPDQIEVYLRGSLSHSGQRQRAQYVRASLDDEGRIASLTSGKKRIPVKVAWLEPETLSPLGSNERRAVTPTTLSETSPWLLKALIAIEDERFYHHFGVDPIGIARAMAINFRSGELRQGGSTLTQQLAKNLFYGSERTITRKVKEAVAAVLIETAFTKDEILELYLNEIFLGQDGQVAIHGFGEASVWFFGKDVADLSLAEAATLVGIIKAPSYYSPRRSAKRAVVRRNVVLAKMLEQKKITEAEYRQAKDEPLKVKDATRLGRKAPYYVDYIRSVLSQAAPIESLSLQPVQIHSGIDVEYQNCAEAAVSKGLADLERRFPRLKRTKGPLQAGLVSVTPATGEFLAWVGGRAYGANQFEHVSQALRQTGSVFKPIVYLTALDAGLNSYRVARTTSLLVDEPVRLEQTRGRVWQPQNYDKQFHGDVTLREALVRSLNVPAVQLTQKVGIDSVIRTATQLGVERELPAVPALALGAAELTPLEVARAYASIANGGRLAPFRPIISITKNSSTPDILFEAPLRDSQRISEAAAFVLTDMLASAVDRGTGRSVRTSGYKGPVAGKTGTTNDARDSWFAGYTPHLLTVVWVGFDDNSKAGLTGGQAAAPIWSAYMQCVEAMEPKLEFVPPPGVVYKEIDYETGLLASESCDPSVRTTEIFVKGTEPVRVCDQHGGGYFSVTPEEPSRARINVGRPSRSDPRRRGVLDSIIDSIWR